MKPRGGKQQAAALERAIMRLESKASTFYVESSFARSEGHSHRARFFAMKSIEAREDAALLADLMENLPKP